MNLVSKLPARRSCRSPRAEALETWLHTPAVVMDTGEVRSWYNPDHPGYPYPEAAGLWLALACRDGRLHSAADVDRVASALAARAMDSGAVGRNGELYVFDSAVALNGLCAHARERGARSQEHAEAMGRLFGFIAAGVAERLPVVPAAGTALPVRWSTVYGPHLLKCVVGLHSYADLSGHDAPRETAARLVADLADRLDGARFPSVPGDSPTYMHACLYGFEGLAYLHARAIADHGAVLDRGAAWLADVQRDDGAIVAWFASGAPSGPGRADATAQAIRFWSMRGRDQWASQIRRASEFLATMQTASGALRYDDRSSDENTWATIFAAQALEWSAGDFRPNGMI